MSRTTQSSVVTFAPSRIVPVVMIEDSSQAEPLREALKAGGLFCAEITFRTEAAGESIRIMAEDPDFVVGAGTVVTADQVEQALLQGARFVVSPGVSTTVVHSCQEMGMPVFPGVCTPTEVMAALDLGLRELKFFPAAAAGGVPALKALGAPFGTVRFIPTGGIGPGDVGDYLALPNVAAVGGSWLTPTQAMAAGNFETVSRLAAEAIAISGVQES